MCVCVCVCKVEEMEIEVLMMRCEGGGRRREGIYFGLGCSVIKGKKEKEGMVMLSLLAWHLCSV